MSTIPSRVLDLSGPLGAAPGYFILRTYDEPAFRRFTFSDGGVESGEIRVAWPAVALFEAFVGSKSGLFISFPVDLTQTHEGIELVPAWPGLFFMPMDDGALRLFNNSGAGTLTSPPTIRIGNNVNHDNLGTGSLKAEAFTAGTDWLNRPALERDVLVALMADMTSPILIDVLTPGVGTDGFAWTASFVMSGTWMVADSGSFVPAY